MSDPPPPPTRRQLLWRWCRRGTLLVVATIGIALIIGESEAFKHCKEERKHAPEYNDLYERSGILGGKIIRLRARTRLAYVCAWHFTEKSEGALVALATLALSIFTFTLWRSTDKLWRSSIEHAGHANRAIAVAERSAERQLRAYLTVEPGGISFWSIGEQPCGRITVRNRGATPAYNVEIAIIFDFTDAPPIVDISETAPKIRTGDMSIAPGAHQNADIYSVSPVVAPLYGEVMSGQKMIVMAGVVTYLDAFKKPRKTRFCHIYRGDNLDKENVRYHHLGNSST